MNPYKFQVVEFTRNYPYGTDNRIVVSAATLKGCLNQYNKHIETFRAAKISHSPLKTVFYCDGTPFEVNSI